MSADGTLLALVLADARNVERLKGHQIGSDELDQLTRRDCKPSPSLAVRVAEALDMPLHDLFPQLGHRGLHLVESDHERQL